jgi:hypothetical protein
LIPASLKFGQADKAVERVQERLTFAEQVCGNESEQYGNCCLYCAVRTSWTNKMTKLLKRTSNALCSLKRLDAPNRKTFVWLLDQLAKIYADENQCDAAFEVHEHAPAFYQSSDDEVSAALTPCGMIACIESSASLTRRWSVPNAALR